MNEQTRLFTSSTPAQTVRGTRTPQRPTTRRPPARQPTMIEALYGSVNAWRAAVAAYQAAHPDWRDQVAAVDRIVETSRRDHETAQARMVQEHVT